MLASMTGFGAGRSESPVGSISIELRSVNSRYLDVSIRLPHELSLLESDARQTLQKAFTRGKISMSTRFHPIPGATQHYSLNTALLDVLEKACRDRGETPSLEKLLSIQGIVLSEIDDSSQEIIRKMFLEALNEACKNLGAERLREGKVLAIAIDEIRKEMVERVAAIESAKDEVVTKYRDRLKERLEDLLGAKSTALDPGRLEQEVTIFADKADINEEIIRLNAHMDQLKKLLTSKGDGKSQGRPIDFLCQEILRETNTVGSKCRDLGIAQEVLAMKNLIENMKEQVANIA